MNSRLYQDKICMLATMHKKEEAIAPPFLEVLGLRTQAAELDTDQFGTFSGEIKRRESQVITAKKKCELALKVSSGTIACSSEGSFGPHPAAIFLPIGVEILYFIDLEVGISLYETLVTEETNYRQTAIACLDDLADFAKMARFPSHGLIIRPNQGSNNQHIFKGIQDESELRKLFSTCCSLSIDNAAWVETDMRAHKNPTRMQTIQKLACKLAERLNCPCPKCCTPGWGETEKVSGLPCEFCAMPTDLVLGAKWQCLRCDYTAFKEEEKKSAEQQYCHFCNP